MAEAPKFQRLQRAFAAHIRDPDKCPAPEGIEDRRMAVYRDLFLNNVSSLLAGTFPVLHRILGRERWDALARDFLIRHRARTPYFLELPEEFLSYLMEEREAHREDPPFLFELAHYEWVELALTVAENPSPHEDLDPDGDLLAGPPVLSPLAWPLRYAFPVHRISPDYQPAEAPAEPTFIVVYRDAASKVTFTEINIVTARLLELLQQQPSATGDELIGHIAAELTHIDPQRVRSSGETTLAELRSRGILLGTRRG